MLIFPVPWNYISWRFKGINGGSFLDFFIGNTFRESSYILSPCQLFPHVALLKPACQWGTPEGRNIVDFHSAKTKEDHNNKQTNKKPTKKTPQKYLFL